MHRLVARVAAVVFAPTLAAAQDAGQPFVLETIEIFGSRVANTLDDSTASVAVTTETELEERVITSIRGAFRTMANVIDSDFVDAGFVIRGVNSEGLTPGGAPLASFYLDGIQQTVNGARRGARGVFDVRQVEVYRGPQSTLTGRAALAGAVYVKTNDPTYEQEAVVQGTIGTMETAGAAFLYNTPIVDGSLAFRLVGEWIRSENDINYPNYKDFKRFEDFVTDEYYQLRGKVLFEPQGSPGTRAVATYSYAFDSPYSNDIGGPLLGFDYEDDRGDFNLPTFTEDREATNQNAGLEVTHDFGTGLLFTSLTTYSDNRTDRPSVNEGTPGETNVVRGNLDQWLFTQELRLNYAGPRLDAVGGLYFAREENDSGFRRPDYFGASDVSSTSESVTNLALFGEANYAVVPGWRVIAGGRIDYSDIRNDAFFSRNGVALTDDALSSDETVFLPKIGLLREFGVNQSLGFTIQRGFRSGGVGVQRSTGEVYDVEPEYTWTYELAYRGRFLDERLGVAANLFYTDWENQQVEVLDDPNDFTSSRIVNAAESRSWGFELEGRMQATEAASLFAGVGYVNSEFENFADASLGDVSGLPFPEAPEWTVSAGADYRLPSGFYAGVDAEYVDGYLARFGQAPQEYVDSRVVVNAQLGYLGERYDVIAFADNVFDERYYTYTDNDIAATLGPRRVVGLRAQIRF